MRIAIVDSNYSNAKYFGMAASWLRWELSNAGVEESKPDAADFLLCTVSSQQGVSALRGALRKIKNKRARVIVGGGGAWAPAVFDGIADVCCVGEGADFVRTLLKDGFEAARSLPEAWIPGEKNAVIPNEKFPWDVPPINHPDGTVRIFGARGCKHKCLFCQTGWEASYRPNPNPKRLAAVSKMLIERGRRVAVVTNDGADMPTGLGGKQEFLSMRLAGLMRLMREKVVDRNFTKGVRLGVEGVSERLRRSVLKPIKNDDLINTSRTLLDRGVGVTWFFITGLPMEAENDWLELRDLIDGVRTLKKGCVMMVFHAFIPQPATPLGVLPVEDKYWEFFEEFRRWFFHGPGFTRRAQFVAPAKYPGRLRRAMESMAATESEVRAGWMQKENANWRVKYPVGADKLRRIAARYCRGLS